MTYSEVLEIWKMYVDRHSCMGLDYDNIFEIDGYFYRADRIDLGNGDYKVDFVLVYWDKSLEDLVVEDFVYSVESLNTSRNYKLKSVTLADSVKVIGNSAFMNCINLVNINLDNVISIGNNAFKNTFSLYNITFSQDLEFIGTRAFEHSGLQFLDFSNCNKIHTIGSHCFSYCLNLKCVKDFYCEHKRDSDDLNLSNSGLQEGVFKGCDSLESVTFYKLDNISKEMFFLCRSLEFVTIKQNYIVILSDAFYGCQNLKTVFAHNIDSFKAFDMCGNVSFYLNRYKINDDGEKVFVNYKLDNVKGSYLSIIYNNEV